MRNDKLGTGPDFISLQIGSGRSVINIFPVVWYDAVSQWIKTNLGFDWRIK
jgi:hypothetical protein